MNNQFSRNLFRINPRAVPDNMEDDSKALKTDSITKILVFYDKVLPISIKKSMW